MQTGHSSGAAAPFDGLIRLLVRTLSLGGIIGGVVTAFYVLPSGTKSPAPAAVVSSTKQRDDSGAAQGSSAQAQASGPRVVYAGYGVPSGAVPKPEPAAQGPEAASSAKVSLNTLPGPTLSGAPASAASQAAPAAAPSSTSKPTALPPSSVVQGTSVSEKVERPARQTGSVVNLNTATLEELNRLRGAGLIGRAIMRRRPYTTPEDLLKKKVLSRAAYARIKDQIAAR